MGGEAMGRVILLFLAVLFMTAGCKTTKKIEYVPLPQHHKRTESKKDSIHITDSVSESKTIILQEVDSPYLAGLGIVKPPNKAWLLRESHNIREKNSKSHESNDTVIEQDTILVPYPVIKQVEVNKLYWWQNLLMWAGSLFSLICIVYGIINIYRLKHNSKS